MRIVRYTEFDRMVSWRPVPRASAFTRIWSKSFYDRWILVIEVSNLPLSGTGVVVSVDSTLDRCRRNLEYHTSWLYSAYLRNSLLYRRKGASTNGNMTFSFDIVRWAREWAHSPSNIVASNKLNIRVLALICILDIRWISGHWLSVLWILCFCRHYPLLLIQHHKLP